MCLCVHILPDRQEKRGGRRGRDIHWYGNGRMSPGAPTFLQDSHNRAPQVLVKHSRVISETRTHMGNDSHLTTGWTNWHCSSLQPVLPSNFMILACANKTNCLTVLTCPKSRSIPYVSVPHFQICCLNSG